MAALRKKAFVKPSDATGKKYAEFITAARMFPAAPLHNFRGRTYDDRYVADCGVVVVKYGESFLIWKLFP